MANETILPIRDIPGTGTPSATSMVALDSGVAMFPAELSALADAVRPMASESEAEAGVDAVKGMSPLTVKKSIASEVGDTLASAGQGALADTAVQPARSISAGSGLTGGGDLSADRSIALNAASISSLSKADSAVQPGVTITAGTGLTGGGDLSANRTLSLNSASVASLAKADDAVLYTAQTLTAPQQTLVRTQIGLGNVDNTADASKPISTATQSALNAKADAARTITAGTGLTGGGDLTSNRSIGLSASSVASLGRADTAVQATGTSAQYIRGDGVFAAFPAIPQGTVTSVAATVPTGLAIAGSPITSSGTLAISYASGYVGYTTAEQTKLSGISAGAQVNTVTSVAGKTGAVTLVKADVGLGSVDNTSDANKPVSTATQTALNAKANTTTTISAGTGLDGGGTLAANRSIALNAASVASLAKADSAVQLGANGSMPAGGASGQILAKSSAADYAVGWISSEAATAVSYGPQTLTGPQQTQARANISVPVGAFRNKIINPLFAVNQRGVSGTVARTAGQYGHDRFRAGSSGCTYTFSTSNGVTTITITAGSLQQVIEAGAFAGEPGTYVLSWSGTAQARIDTGAYGTSANVTATINGSANVTVEWGVGTVSLPQLEFAYATPFAPRHPNQEWELCFWYYERWVAASGGRRIWLGPAVSTSTSSGISLASFRPKRAQPVVTVSGGWRLLGANNGNAVTVTPSDRNENGQIGFQLSGTFATNAANLVQSDDTVTAAIAIDAEL